MTSETCIAEGDTSGTESLGLLTSDIGDTFSSARCPSLRELRFFNAQGVSNLSIYSESLVHIYLKNLKGLQQLTVASPMLRDLSISNCFFERQPVADITAPVLEKFIWLDEYDPRSVQLGKLAQLRRFRKIPALVIMIDYPTKMVYCQNWMEALTSLPVEILDLVLLPCGHAIGSCVFHFLKISTFIRCLFLDIREAIKMI
ncbi:unnamed protein product [Miscanthus lutarioriparius]|uniref:Uncharacterized protein n=1 Tax=Miscanthus lutarioriparius TaxID=422564 RepID=A0A811NGB3_9POAL|nr:unnamed protein product [Miscanthus lutarioriparius]